MALVPGLPKIPFLIVGGSFLLLSRALRPFLLRRKKSDPEMVPSHAKDQLCTDEAYIELCRQYEVEPKEPLPAGGDGTAADTQDARFTGYVARNQARAQIHAPSRITPVTSRHRARVIASSGLPPVCFARTSRT